MAGTVDVWAIITSSGAPTAFYHMTATVYRHPGSRAWIKNKGIIHGKHHSRPIINHRVLSVSDYRKYQEEAN
jgi:hypothetical protein